MKDLAARTEPSASVRLRYSVQPSGKMISTATKAMAGPANSHLRWRLAQRDQAGVRGEVRCAGCAGGAVRAVMGSPAGEQDGRRWAGARRPAGPPARSASVLLVVQQ